MFVKPEKTLAIIVEFRNITICIFENLAMETKMTHPITKLLTSFAVLIFLTACGNTLNINPDPDGEPDIFEQIKILEKKRLVDLTEEEQEVELAKLAVLAPEERIAVTVNALEEERLSDLTPDEKKAEMERLKKIRFKGAD